MKLDWPKVRDLSWKAQMSAIEAAVRVTLSELPHDATMRTRELAEILLPGVDVLGLDEWSPAHRRVTSRLAKLAPWMPGFATHDGEVFWAYGRRNQRWLWHGQDNSRSINPETGEITLDDVLKWARSCPDLPPYREIAAAILKTYEDMV